MNFGWIGSRSYRNLSSQLGDSLPYHLSLYTLHEKRKDVVLTSVARYDGFAVAGSGNDLVDEVRDRPGDHTASVMGVDAHVLDLVNLDKNSPSPNDGILTTGTHDQFAAFTYQSTVGAGVQLFDDDDEAEHLFGEPTKYQDIRDAFENACEFGEACTNDRYAAADDPFNFPNWSW